MPDKNQARAKGRFTPAAKISLEDALKDMRDELRLIAMMLAIRNIAEANSVNSDDRPQDVNNKFTKTKTDTNVRSYNKDSLKRTFFGLYYRLSEFERRAEQVKMVCVSVQFMAAQTIDNIGALDFAQDGMSLSFPFEVPQDCIDLHEYISQDDNDNGEVHAAFRAQLVVINEGLRIAGSKSLLQSRMDIRLPFKVLTLPGDVDIQPIRNNQQQILEMTIILQEDSVATVDKSIRCVSTIGDNN